jgi:hypothetical protein
MGKSLQAGLTCSSVSELKIYVDFKDAAKFQQKLAEQ